MAHVYSAFGLSIMADRAIPGMAPAAAAGSIDTHIWLGTVSSPLNPLDDDENAGESWYVSEPEEGRAPALRASRLKHGRYFRLLYSDGTDFLVDRAGANVWARWPSSSSLADTATYLLGPVLGFVLRLRGVTCLHGSAVSIGRASIALVGPQGAGKSTTAAVFGRLHHAVLADDIVPVSRLDGTWWVQPAYPQLRLWPDAVGALCGAPDALPPLTPTWDKRALDLTMPGYRFQDHRLPLAAIYLLDGRPSGPEPAIEELGGRSGLMTLLGNTYVSYLMENPMRARELDDLAGLAADVPLRRVTHSRDLSDVSRLCAAILADCGSLGCTA